MSDSEPPTQSTKENFLSDINERFKNAEEAGTAALQAWEHADETSDASEKQQALEKVQGRRKGRRMNLRPPRY